MKLVFIYGPPASGKLTIAKKLSQLTGFRLFHNHVSIEFVKSLFDFGTTPFWRLTDKYRLEMIEEAAKQGINTIFTFVYGTNDDPFVKTIVRKVRSHDGKVCFVRLHCEKRELQKRVNSKTRKAFGKISSRKKLAHVLRRFDMESEVPFRPSLTIDTTNQSPLKAARTIAQFYKLRSVKTHRFQPHTKLKARSGVCLAGRPSVTLPAKAILYVILAAFLATGFLRVDPGTRTPFLSPITPTIPIQTDDRQDPITLIFTGYAPSWWVASNLAGWGDSAYCSGPKTVGGAAYNYTLEHPDPSGLPCYGPRDHIRIWDMGYSPVFGEWSIASAHHEHTLCDPICHHVIDSWDRAKADAASSFLVGQATLSVSNYSLANAGLYQGVYNDGNATMVYLKPPSGSYAVVFTENGLSNQTSWSVTINKTTTASSRPAIVFAEQNGTYPFSVGTPQGFNSSPSSGTIVISGSGAFRNVLFRTPWTTSVVSVDSPGGPVTLSFSGNATIETSSVQLTTNGGTIIRFLATEIGPKGVLNVTVPKSTLTLGASASVFIDGALDANSMASSDNAAYHAYFTLSYGKHTVELLFPSIGLPYTAYLAGGTIATITLGTLFLVFRSKARIKNRYGSKSDSIVS